MLIAAGLRKPLVRYAGTIEDAVQAWHAAAGQPK
jgi:hypothetical protein